MKNLKKTKKKKTLKLNNLELYKNKKIGIAVSGGVDSVVLLDLMFSDLKKVASKIFVLHFNHNWRKESVKDKRLVESYCKKYKLSFVYGEMKKQKNRSEEIAREKRYEFFKKSASKHKIDIICTAHHLDDQVETILFRLARGTGPRGLLPIKNEIKLEKGVMLFRPLLAYSKEDLVSYSKQRKLIYNEDKTNKDTKYKRNLIRHKIIPLLKEVNQDAKKNILAASDLAYSCALIAEIPTEKLLKKISMGSEFKWDKGKYLKLKEFEKNAIIYHFFNEHNIPGSLSKIDTIKSLMLSSKKESLDLDEVFRLEVGAEAIVFKNKSLKKKTKSLKKSFVLNGKNNVQIDVKSFLQIEPYLGSEFKESFPPDKKKLAYVNMTGFIGEKLDIRFRNEKDKFKPLGCSYNMKLKNYLISRKIPENKRNQLPLLCLKDEILWIPGYSLSQKLKVSKLPTHVLKIVRTS